MTKNRESGSDAAMRKREMTLRRCEQMPGPSSQADHKTLLSDYRISDDKINKDVEKVGAYADV